MRDFGELERQVMHNLWARVEPASVRDVVEDLRSERRIAYTTVMTAMDNLHRKGWLRRTKQGRAYRYWPTLTREEHGARLMGQALHGSDNPDLVLSQFVGQITDAEVTRLRDLVARFAPEDPA